MQQILRSQRVVTAAGVRPATIAFEDGRIVSLAADSDDASVIDVGDAYVLPGLVDSHVHVNEPGRTHWEGFITATNAAAAGGCTCIVDMPLNAIPATTAVAALDAKRFAAQGQCRVDYAFWGGVVPGNQHELLALAQSGARGFKCFLVESGVDEFGCVTESDLDLAMPLVATTGLPLLVHAELPGPLRLQSSQADWRRYATHLDSRPAAAEIEAVALMIRLCRKYHCPVHIVHLSSAEAAALLRDARAEGLPMTGETCPQYLYFAAEDVPDRATQFKCAPPIRDAANRDLLWRYLGAGLIDLIATDHSPCPPELKNVDTGDFSSAWGGIASLSLALSVIWTAARARGFGIEDVVRWMSTNTAQLAGIAARKGQIAVGFDADLVIFDPDARFTVTQDHLHFRHPVSPYLGEALQGRVRETYVRGQRVFAEGHFAHDGCGIEVTP